jgi:hypothetical protein
MGMDESSGSQHVDGGRLYAAIRGGPLNDAEAEHLSSCEMCQELLAFLAEYVQTAPPPKKTA